MTQKRDWVSYFIGILGLFLTILAMFQEEIWKIVLLIWGAAGLTVAVVMIYINQFLDKMVTIGDQVNELKKEYGFSEQLIQIKREIERVKSNKKAKYTNLEDLLKTAFLLILLYLILKTLEIIP